jgi:hypothetical protein
MWSYYRLQTAVCFFCRGEDKRSFVWLRVQTQCDSDMYAEGLCNLGQEGGEWVISMKDLDHWGGGCE